MENLGILLSHTDRSTATLDFLRKANAGFPNSEALWLNRLLVAYTLGHKEEALLASHKYYLLKKDDESYRIYNTLLHNLPFNIRW